MCDDLGWADVEFHGGNAPTPNLNRLAKESVELTQHYVAPVCSPTRTSLMTGRCWSRYDVTTPDNARALPWDEFTLPRALKQAGYATCLTGKWHLGSLPNQGPNHFGFDHSYGSLAGGVAPWNHHYKQGPFVNTWHRNESLIEESGHVTDLITTEALSWLKEHHRQPFFLYVPYTAVHLPIREPEEWLSKVPASISGDVARQYAACVMHMDDCVGRLLNALNALAVEKDTIVVFTSDNGGSWAENNDTKYPDDQCPNGKLVGNNKPWRGQKGELYEGGIHVPALVRYPSAIKPGQVDTPVQIIDWMPTLCRFANVTDKVPSAVKWDGIDLSKLLIERQPIADRPLYSVAPAWRARSLRYGDWKLIEQQANKSVKYELFNLKNDPQEQTDLSGRMPEQVELLKQQLTAISAGDKLSAVKE